MMMNRFVRRVLLLLASGVMLTPLFAAEAPVSPSSSGVLPIPALTEKTNRVFQPLTPGPTDGRIAFVTAAMLQQNHYLHKTFNGTVSSQFLDRYLEVFDPQHIHFIQADLDEFEKYRTNLNHLILTAKHEGDTHPAYEIFNRFMQRLQQRAAYSEQLLKTEKFTFDADERVLLARQELPYPKDIDAAKKLWRERVRAEYLAEKLARIDSRKKAETNAPAVAKNLPRTKTDEEEIVDTLTRRYQRNLHLFNDWDSDDVLQAFLTTLAHVYDPHSDYMGKAQVDQFQISMNLSLFGIGAELQQTPEGFCKINRLLPNGPAMNSKKIKEGDRILAVAQSNQPPVDIVDMNLSKAVQLIRGAKGTEVRLTVNPAGSDPGVRSVVPLVRDEIPLEDSAAKAKLIEVPDLQGGRIRLGVIDLPSFYAPFDLGTSKHNELASTDPGASTKSTTGDVARLLKKLKEQHVQGVILDLRRNGGGVLDEAIRLSGLFIEEGPIVQVKDFTGNVKAEMDPDPTVAYDGPLVVLTSRFSASASEILAGALQDYGRALIVGDVSTHGKGTVQMVEPLERHMGVASATDPGALKFTIKKFYRPSGASTQKRGVLADLVLPSIWNESKEIGESALEYPLEWDTIPSARYDTLNLVTPYLPELRQRSSQRMAKDQEFAYTREDIEIFKKQQADKTVSLNEKQRLQEKEENEARAKARDKERAARTPVIETAYDLTLKAAAMPGLPPPITNPAMAKVVFTNSTMPQVASTGSAPAVFVFGTNTSVVKIPAALTNSATATPDIAVALESVPAPDETLIETEHILVDYLSLLPKRNLLSSGPRQP
jgi:carboxyl-terminal processing protease